MPIRAYSSLLLVAAVAWLPTGCSSTVKDKPKRSGDFKKLSGEAKSLVTDMSAAYCTRMFRCCTNGEIKSLHTVEGDSEGSGIGFGSKGDDTVFVWDEKSCRRHMENNLIEELTNNLEPLRRAGSVRLHTEVLAACLEQFANSCQPLQHHLSDLPIDSVIDYCPGSIEGLIADGESCQTGAPWTCRGGFCEQEKEQCMSPSNQVGDACDANSDCKTGHCAEEGECAAQVGISEKMCGDR